MNIYGILTSENVDNMNEKILVDGVDIGTCISVLTNEFTGVPLGILKRCGKVMNNPTSENEFKLYELAGHRPFIIVCGNLIPPHDQLAPAIREGRLYWALGGYATEIIPDALIENGAIVKGSRLITKCRLTEVALTVRTVSKIQRVFIDE